MEKKSKKLIKRTSVFDTRYYPVKYCKKCGAETLTIDSRPSDRGIYRRRECPICKTRFTTFEIMEEEANKLEVLKTQAARLRRIAKATLEELESEEE